MLLGAALRLAAVPRTPLPQVPPARLRLAQAVETQFDTTVVAAFEAILAAAGEDYRSGRGSSFMRERLRLEQDEIEIAPALDVLA